MSSITITTKEIAKIARVSQSTVSRSLNDSPLVSDDTKQKIKQIALDLGFEFNANARSLITNKTGSIGMIYPENFDDFSFNLYFSSLYHFIRESLEKANLDLIVTFLRNRFTGQNGIKKLVSRKKVDGFIIVQSHLNLEILNFLTEQKVPFVFMHLYPGLYKESEVNAVYTDHFRGGYLAAEHLINLGRKRILCLSVAGEDEFEMRTEGLKAAHYDYHLQFPEKLLFYGNRTFRTGYRILIENKQILKNIDAIFAQTDLMALGAITALQELNVRVPEEISIIGYDDIELGTYYKPYLSTIRQPREEIALLTCERLVELLNTRKPNQNKKLAIQPRLIIRESCGGNSLRRF